VPLPFRPYLANWPVHMRATGKARGRALSKSLALLLLVTAYSALHLVHAEAVEVGRRLEDDKTQAFIDSMGGTWDYPVDLFTFEQLKSGAVVLHIIGVMYMFLALAIACDEFFVPALEMIVEASRC